MIRLVVRADDAGSCSEANRAIAACVDAGVVQCVSVMAVGPALEEAATLLADRPGIEIGLHVALNSEWEQVTWGPVLPVERVPSLVAPAGAFLPFPADLQAKGFSVPEALAEVAAQLARLRAVGFRPAYLDEHCGISWIAPELKAGLDEFAASEGLMRVAHLPYLAGVPITALANQIGGFPDGGYVVVAHPGIDEPGGVMRRFHLRGEPNDGTVARERDAERQALCDPGLQEALRRQSVTLVRYSDLLR